MTKKIVALSTKTSERFHSETHLDPRLHPQMRIGEVDVSRITFDARSRDNIPKILRGLLHLYTDTSLRAAVFELLTEQIAPKINKDNGRPGMTLWSILVCGVVRLDLNIDYDRLQELVNGVSQETKPP